MGAATDQGFFSLGVRRPSGSCNPSLACAQHGGSKYRQKKRRFIVVFPSLRSARLGSRPPPAASALSNKLSNEFLESFHCDSRFCPFYCCRSVFVHIIPSLCNIRQTLRNESSWPRSAHQTSDSGYGKTIRSVEYDNIEKEGSSQPSAAQRKLGKPFSSARDLARE